VARAAGRGGIVDAEDPGNGNRTYRLPPEHADVLIDPESASYLAPFASLVTGIGGVLPEVADAYRSGGGVPFSRYGADLRDGQAAINRPAFTAEMADWIATMRDVDARLKSDQPAEPTGTVLREPTVRDLADRAGFSSVEVLPIDNDFFRFYRLRL
jgi:hypothetical protein